MNFDTTRHFSFVETQTKATALLAVSSLPTLAKISSNMNEFLNIHIMKKTIILLSLLFAHLVAQAQLSELTFAQKLTEEHKQIKGTNFHLIMPEDYEMAGEFAGITDGAASLLMFMKVPKNPDFSEISTDDARKEMEKKGLKVTEITRLKNVKGQPLVMTGSGKKGSIGMLQIMMNIPGSAWLVIGVFTDEDEKEEILNCLKSLYIDAGKKIDLDKVRKFKIDLSGTDFKFDSYNGVFFQYISNGTKEAKLVRVVQMPWSTLDGKSFKKFCEEQVQRLTKEKDTEVIEKKAVKTKAGKGYCIITRKKGALTHTLYTGDGETLLMIYAKSDQPLRQSKKAFEKLLFKKISLK